MIKISDEIMIDSDGVQYITREKVTVKGKDMFQAVAYHPSLKMALSRLIKQKEIQLVMDNEMSLEQALKRFKTIADEMEETLNRYVKEEL